jgi:hypothetical protein
VQTHVLTVDHSARFGAGAFAVLLGLTDEAVDLAWIEVRVMSEAGISGRVRAGE